MLEVEIDRIVPSPSGLRFGLIVRYGKDGPVRFAAATLPWRAFTSDVRVEMLDRFNRMVDDTLAEEPDEQPMLDWDGI